MNNLVVCDFQHHHVHVLQHVEFGYFLGVGYVILWVTFVDVDVATWYGLC